MGDELWPGLAGAGLGFLVSWAGTWLVMRAVEHWQILDRPGQRSVHRRPMPTLGGLGVILGFWVGLSVLVFAEFPIFIENALWAQLGATLALLLIACDEARRPLGVLEKLAIQVGATSVWLYWGVHLEWVPLPLVGQVELGSWGWAITGLWCVGMCNVYNFMDGIDGITALETIVVGCLAFLSLAQLDAPLWGMALLLVAVSGGFLAFNFPPARIFAGDVGAGFLGFTLAILGVLGERAGLPIWLYLTFLGYYLFDVSYTLLRRALKGENLLQAHRKHLYQRLNKLGWCHLKINLWICCLTLTMGLGAWIFLFVDEISGAALGLLGGGLVLGTTIWIEAKDRDFGSG